MNRMIAAILIAIIALTFTHTTHAAPLDPTDGILTHSFLDTESDVFVAVMTTGNETFGISFLHESTLPFNGHTDVFTQTDDTISFMQSDIMYTAAIVHNMSYNGVLSDRYVRVYEDNSTCALFHLTITETNEHMTVCLDPTDSPNADNGIVSLQFGNPFDSGHWQGEISQGDHKYPFMTTDDIIPSNPTIIYLPIVQ